MFLVIRYVNFFLVFGEFFILRVLMGYSLFFIIEDKDVRCFFFLVVRIRVYDRFYELDIFIYDVVVSDKIYGLRGIFR